MNYQQYLLNKSKFIYNISDK